jgi:hypothetical protein
LRRAGSQVKRGTHGGPRRKGAALDGLQPRGRVSKTTSGRPCGSRADPVAPVGEAPECSAPRFGILTMPWIRSLLGSAVLKKSWTRAGLRSEG